MRLIIDTHVLLWAVFEPARLSRRARAEIADPSNDLLLSAVTAWEIATKVRTNKLILNMSTAAFLADQRRLLALTDLSLTVEHAAAVEQLPDLHRDPGDRLLIAQARFEGIPLISDDRQIARYPVSVIW